MDTPVTKSQPKIVQPHPPASNGQTYHLEWKELVRPCKEGGREGGREGRRDGGTEGGRL